MYRVDREIGKKTSRLVLAVIPGDARFANKTARFASAIMVKAGVYEVGDRASRYRAEACVIAG